MEIILLIVVIILLIIQNSKTNNHSKHLSQEINTLNDKLNVLHRLFTNEKPTKTIEKESFRNVVETSIKTSPVDHIKKSPAVNKEAEEHYKVSYPNVTKLTDKDVSIIKDIFKTTKNLEKLRIKMIEVLNIVEVKEKTDIAFISTILKDYDYYAQKNQSIEAKSIVPEETQKETSNKPIKVSASTKNVMTAAPTKKITHQPADSVWERFKQRNPDLEKFIGENLINKIGILILVLGVSYFVKYAIDKNWINEPARVGIGVLAGSLVLFIAHKLRKKYTPFSSVLVAGAISIFYFTIYIAFHEYKLFVQEVAFIIMVVITAFSCLISLSYNRMELAILSLIGGFLVPFMVSTGSGNYVVLFTYIAILDIGILALAYFKKWQLLHILAFAFTLLLFGAWVLDDVNAETPHYAGALIFGFSFYLIFIIINIINNLRYKGNLTKIQLAMLTINNFVFYGIGMLILSDFKPELTGLFTAFLAILNIGYSVLLYKKFGLDKRGVYLLIGLSLTFITLAIPVQFSGNSITIFWAIEAVLLMWLSQKSQIKNYRFVSVIVQLLMLCSLVLDWVMYTNTESDLSIVINTIFIAGILVIASFIFVNYLLRHDAEKLSIYGFSFEPILYTKYAHILAIVIGYLVGLFEVIYQSNQYFDFNAALAVILQYHLLFTTVFCFILFKNRTTSNDKVINIIAVLNIIGFTLLFSRIPFWEFSDNLLDGTHNKTAYYLHMLSLVFIISLWYLVYSTNKKQKVFSIFNDKLAIWSAVLALVAITSTEVVLQGLHMLGLSANELQLSDQYGSVYDIISTSKYKIIKTGLPVLWGVLAFILLLWGIKKQIKQLRIIALTLLGLTIVKLFVYDISNVSETGKIIAFILLGVLILIISFVYQKIKVLVIDENKATKNNEID